MELLIYMIIWLMLGALFVLYLIKVNSPLWVRSSLRIAYEITLHEAEQIEIPKKYNINF